MGTIYKRGRTYWIQYSKSGQVFRESTKSSKKMVATRSVFEPYNIFNDRDLQLALQRQEAYLKSQNDTKMTQIADFDKKRKIKNVA